MDDEIRALYCKKYKVGHVFRIEIVESSSFSAFCRFPAMRWYRFSNIVRIMNLNIKKIRTILLHGLFWAGVWFFFLYFFSYNSVSKAYVSWFSSALLPLTMVVSYFIVYRLIPKFLLTHKYLKFFLYGFYTVVFSSYIIVLIIYACLIFLLDFNISIMPPMSKNFFFILILVFLIVGLVSFVSVLNHHFIIDKRNRELQNRILGAQLQIKDQELSYLKMQIHPHFLFNTLNTIYGFAIKNSHKTPEIILKLSNLLDYILYQVNKPRVSLKDEVLHIQEYVDLERIRFQETLKVEMNFSNIPDSVQIAPMLLIPFVENAFKHGQILDGYLNVFIDIDLSGDELAFSIKNTIVSDDIDSKEGGIGLENISKRLELNYPENHSIDYRIEGQWYIVNLSIFNVKNMQNV